MPIKPTTRNTRSKLALIAKQSGDKKQVATQEIKQAFDKGVLTKAERKLMARARSECDGSVGAMEVRLKSYDEAFAKTDLNKNGHIETSERKQAQDHYDEYLSVATTSDVPREQLAAALAKVVTAAVMSPSGTIRQRPVSAIGTLMKEMTDLTK